MRILIQDVRYGLRALLKNRAVGAVAVVALALGIGANSAVFTIVNAVLLNPLSYRQPERIVWVWGSAPELPKARLARRLPRLEGAEPLLRVHGLFQGAQL